MKIIIRSNDGPKHLTLHFPLAFIKTKLASKIMVSAMKETDVNVDISEIHGDIKNAYGLIKQEVKRRGHFNIIEIDSADGEKVIIRV